MKNKTDNFTLILGICIILFTFSSIYFLNPKVQGDSLTYLSTINYLDTGIKSADFVPNRIITTLGALEIIIFLSKIFGSVTGVWLAMNAFFYAVTIFVFYRILHNYFDSNKVALLGTLFLATNYSFIWFGLHFLMDIGGWTFYIISLYYILQYADYRERKYLLLSSLFVGIGSLFKEYALLGIIPIAVFLIYENRSNLLNLFKKAIFPAIIATGPILLIYVYSFIKFKYTYVDWIEDSYKYAYSSNLLLRIAEYIKSLGSLYNFLALFVILGSITLINEWNRLNTRRKMFVVSTILSFIPIFIWGGVTQRLLFICVPSTIIIASYFFKKNEDKLVYYIPVLFLYIAASFLMDSYILPNINLPF